MNEFELIRRYFHWPTGRADVVLGPGDDCALLSVPADAELAVTMDVLVSGRHFLPDADAQGVGHKALAVNLSDLAAMGAAPAWVTLGLTLPAVDSPWLEGFARGFSALAAAHGVALVGGDTTRGPLAIAVQAAGLVPRGRALRRSGARPGDTVFVTGVPGEAALGLTLLLGTQGGGPGVVLREHLRARLERPEPRVGEGRDLLGIASACIDVSDGLVQDLGHVLAASGVGAVIDLDALPVPHGADDFPPETVRWAQTAGGDDYELLFAVPAARLAALADCSAAWRVPCTPIGVIEPEAGLRFREAGQPVPAPRTSGYDHFR